MNRLLLRLPLAAALVMAVLLGLGWPAAARAATGTGIAALDAAAAVVAALPADGNARTLAVHLSQEGHWTLVNRAGEAFTAATADELKRGFEILLPASAPGPLKAYLTAATVFGDKARLGDLPKDASLIMVDAAGTARTTPLFVATGGSSQKLLAQQRPNLFVELGDAQTFADLGRLLARPLDRSGFRLLSIEPGGPQAFSAKPKVDRSTGRTANDIIDPTALATALPALAGQTAVIVGRPDGDALYVKPASAPERALRWPELVDAAAAADVNLLVLRSQAAQQPGGRNWLWQKVEVKGLDNALSHATLADFFDALASPVNRLIVTADRGPDGRLRLDVHRASGLPSTQSSTAQVGSALSDIVSGLGGKVVHEGAVMHMRSARRQTELDYRLISFLPALLQWGYAALVLVGLVGMPVAWRWWGRLWPAETATEYVNRLGYYAARAIRGLTFATLFLPVTALAAGPVAVIGWFRQTRPTKQDG